MTYWEIQMQAVTALAVLGIQWEAINRIDLFKMRHKVSRDFKAHPALEDTIFLLDELSRMRQLGLEPPHNGKRYV